MKSFKNKIRIALFIGVIFMLQGHSCVVEGDYGPTERETRKVSGFDAIEVSHGIDVYLTIGSKETLEVETAEDLMEHLVTEVSGGTLNIYFDKTFHWSREANVYVQATELHEIKTSGGADLHGEDRLTTTDLELRASGGSDIKLEIDAKNVEVDVSGGADIQLSGTADNIHANSSGGSDLKAFDLVVQKADLEASAGSDIRIHVVDELEAHASSGADISYRGNPQLINTETSSGGDVSGRN